MSRKRKKLILGIDPGKCGGIVGLTLDGEVEFIKEMPDLMELIKFFRNGIQGQVYRVFIEKQNAFPKQGVVSMFRLGEHYGFLKGVLMVLNYSCEEVSSHKWKRFWGLFIKGSRKEKKEKAIKKARELFPYVEDRFKINLKRKDGIAEALLIAEYGRLRLVK